MLVAMPLAMFLTFRPWGIAPAVLQNNNNVTVTNTDDTIVFTPSTAKASGLLLLPGCPVDPIAYAPLARRIADQGHLAAIVKIPYRCAPWPNLEAQLDQRVRAMVGRAPGTRWVLAGHSRGGAHTARMAMNRRAPFAAYVLMGTSHPRDHDLSALSIDVTKIVATRDGVAGEQQFDTQRLPASTHWVRIEGGNHAQFGYYGFQLWDGRATITREEQQAQIVDALLAALTRAQSQP